MRTKLTFEDAVSMLKPGDYVHTFMAAGGVLIGADWKRAEAEEAIISGEPELAGKIASSMNHGLAVKDAVGGWVFMETVKHETEDAL